MTGGRFAVHMIAGGTTPTRPATETSWTTRPATGAGVLVGASPQVGSRRLLDVAAVPRHSNGWRIHPGDRRAALPGCGAGPDAGSAPHGRPDDPRRGIRHLGGPHTGRPPGLVVGLSNTSIFRTLLDPPKCDSARTTFTNVVTSREAVARPRAVYDPSRPSRLGHWVGFSCLFTERAHEVAPDSNTMKMLEQVGHSIAVWGHLVGTLGQQAGGGRPDADLKGRDGS